MTETQGGSCEPCKRKKCKCDRNLPICGQCASSPQLCKYAENNKRGIPGGYLGALEIRLNETEIALYNALCELRQLKTQSTFTSHPDLSEPLQARQAHSSKYSRMTEWASYPLRSSSEMEVWWNSFDNSKQPQGPNEERRVMDEPLHNEQVSVNIPGTRNFHFGPLEQPLPPTSNYERSRDTVTYSLQSQDTDQILQEISQPQILPIGHQLNAQGLADRHWHGALDGKELNVGDASETRSEMNRSKELSSRMRYKYY